MSDFFNFFPGYTNYKVTFKNYNIKEGDVVITDEDAIYKKVDAKLDSMTDQTSLAKHYLSNIGITWNS